MIRERQFVQTKTESQTQGKQTIFPGHHNGTTCGEEESFVFSFVLGIPFLFRMLNHRQDYVN